MKQGNAIKGQAKKVGGETKEQVQESKSKIADSENLKKLKEDLKNVLQLSMYNLLTMVRCFLLGKIVVGKDGPSVQPFLDYSSAAWDEILSDENYSRWASEANSLFEVFSTNPEFASQEDYQKQLQELYDRTKEVLDNTVKNENLRLALRESKKYPVFFPSRLLYLLYFTKG